MLQKHDQLNCNFPLQVNRSTHKKQFKQNLQSMYGIGKRLYTMNKEDPCLMSRNRPLILSDAYWVG